MRGRGAVASVAVGLFAISGAATFVQLSAPTDGTIVQPRSPSFTDSGVVVDAVGEGPLRDGDLVVAIDGRPLRNWPRAALPGAAGETVAYQVVRDGALSDVDVTLGRRPVGQVLSSGTPTLVVTGVFFAIAVILFRRRPDEAATGPFVILTAALLASLPPFHLGFSALDVAGGPTLWFFGASVEVGYTVGWSAALAFFLLFPTPHPWLDRHPRLLAAAYFVPPAALVMLSLAVAPVVSGFAVWLGWVTTVQALVTISCVLPAIGLAVHRWVTATDAVERQQLRWLGGSAIISLTAVLAGWFLPDLLTGQPFLPDGLIGLAGVPTVGGFTVAVLRYRLFDLDIVLNRTLLYGGLTVAVVGVYGTVLAVVTSVFNRATDLQGALAASVVIAVVISPIYRGVQLGANRLVYGDRDDPYRALARLGDSLDATARPGGVLSAVAVRVADSLRVPFVAIDLIDESGFERVVTAGGDAEAETELPLTYAGETVGRLLLSGRSPGEPFGTADRRLLVDLSRQVGAAAHGELLARQLQRSRERLVVTREDERSRIRRELHDGLGPTLSALAFQIEVARRTLRDDPEAAERGLETSRREAERLVGEIRRLAHDLRPPALDELGLVEALRQQCCAQSSEMRVEIDADGPVDCLPAAVEVAAYRIAVEAVTNAGRHARARTCRVHLKVAGDLDLRIVDDGCGIPESYTPGVGLLSMRERAAELGGSCIVARDPNGGTFVWARVPIGAS